MQTGRRTKSCTPAPMTDGMSCPPEFGSRIETTNIWPEASAPRRSHAESAPPLAGHDTRATDTGSRAIAATAVFPSATSTDSDAFCRARTTPSRSGFLSSTTMTRIFPPRSGQGARPQLAAIARPGNRRGTSCMLDARPRRRRGKPRRRRPRRRFARWGIPRARAPQSAGSRARAARSHPTSPRASCWPSSSPGADTPADRRRRRPTRPRRWVRRSPRPVPSSTRGGRAQKRGRAQRRARAPGEERTSSRPRPHVPERGSTGRLT